MQWSSLLYVEFEKVKCSFESCDLKQDSTVSVSNKFCTYVKELHGKTIAELINDHKTRLDEDVILSQKLHNCAKRFNKTASEVFTDYMNLDWDEDNDAFVIPSIIMAILFIPVVDQIIKIIEDVLNADKDRSIKSICMVGGFSVSKFLFSEVDKYFSPRIKVSTIPSPSRSVLFGAVKFGKNHNIIRSRIMPQTLGIETWDDFRSDKHDENRKYVDRDGKCYCTQIFTEFVQIGQSISTQSSNSREHVLTPVQNADNTCCISIFGSFEKEPMYINDPNCYRVGEIVIKDLPPPKNGIPCPVTVRMDVRGTEIAVTAISNAAGSRQYPLNLKLDWMKDKFTTS